MFMNRPSAGLRNREYLLQGEPRWALIERLSFNRTGRELLKGSTETLILSLLAEEPM